MAEGGTVTLATTGRRARGAGNAALHCAAAVIISAVAVFNAMPDVLRDYHGIDDVLWAKKALAPIWYGGPRNADDGWSEEAGRHLHDLKWSNDYYRGYYYAIDHPTLARIVYRVVLRAAGVRSIEAEDWDYSAERATNIARGSVLPGRVRRLLVGTNLVFFCGALLLAYAMVYAATGSRVVAAAGSLVLAVEPMITASEYGVVTFVGADAVLLFMHALCGIVLLRMAGRGVGGVAAAGAAAGLAVSTKLNGAFLVGGVMLYYIIYSRGWRRAVWPALALGVAAAVFAVLNPVYVGGLEWMGKVVRDTVEIRRVVIGQHIAAGVYPATKVQAVFYAFPYVLFAGPLAAVFLREARARWFGALACWSAAVVAGNVGSIYMQLPKYAAPARYAFLVVFAAAGGMVIIEVWERLRRRPVHAETQRGEGG